MSIRYESSSSDASPLGKPLKYEFSGKVARNRFLKGAMTERQSSWDPKDFKSRGIPSTNLVNVYKRWGEGEYGQILTGNVMIEYDHLEAMGNPIIPLEAPFEGERFERFSAMAKAGKAHGSLMVAQVSHPGRQVENRIQPNPISASDVQLEGNPMGLSFNKPRPATQEDINSIVDKFAHAAEYLEKAGFDGIQLHGAHGYLLAQFLSKTTNKRTDKYGGSLENRFRIIQEIADEIHKRVKPDFIVGIKMNSVEFQEDGFTPEDAKAACQALEGARFDYVELSGGTYQETAFVHKRESTKKRENFFIEFAEEIVKPLTKTKTYVTGGFKTVGAMVSALDTVDGVGIARPAAQEFRLPKDILEGRVTGAKKMAVDENDFLFTNIAAGTQMRQVGKDQEPIDLSIEKNVEIFKKEMGIWGAKMAADKECKEYGFIDWTQEAQPYGVC
ncbi:putative nadh oxidase protein [Botrytis fragariae]|uniref:Putative nadh oxidase protein n=1 Tax=Botrytis fragariae TaxID=1964551 RepID=A0A8H6EK50_9HELO|nr:putative nadh oxidase protein [Botrytis fragariae]KAF5874800.1 putative nadh oxidase protein [Botrytis fragariae]